MKIASLRIRLLCWLLLPLAGIAALNIWLTYHSADHVADTITDRTLIASARSIAEQTAFTQGVIDVQVPPAAPAMFNTGDADHVYYRGESYHGRMLAGYPHLPTPPPPPPPIPPPQT